MERNQKFGIEIPVNVQRASGELEKYILKDCSLDSKLRRLDKN